MQATSTLAEAMLDPKSDQTTRAFVDHHLLPVWRYLRRHGADAAEADDLSQETFVKALDKGVLNLDPRAARVFLTRTARFVFLHHHRRKSRDPMLADAVDELWDRTSADDGGEQVLATLADCLDKLEGRSRRAIEGHYGIGVDAAVAREDLATGLGLKPNGLKTLLQRTRQLLRDCMEKNLR